jgi:hypothetical protein
MFLDFADFVDFKQSHEVAKIILRVSSRRYFSNSCLGLPSFGPHRRKRLAQSRTTIVPLEDWSQCYRYYACFQASSRSTESSTSSR